MSWQSIDALVADLSLSSNPRDPTSIRQELMERLAAVHPDRTGGEFHSEVQKTEYHTLLAAISDLDTLVKRSTSLVPFDQVVALIQAVQSGQSRSETTRSSISEFLESQHGRLRKRYGLPKLTAAIFAGSCTALLTLMGTYQQSPVYAPIREFLSLRVGEYHYLLAAEHAYAGLSRYGDPDDDFISSLEPPAFESLSAHGLRSRAQAYLLEIAAADSSFSRSIAENKRYVDAQNVQYATDRDSAKWLEYQVFRSANEAISSDEAARAGLRITASRVNADLDAALEAADQLIAILLLVLLFGSATAFSILWLRERSDQQWLEDVTGPDGEMIGVERVLLLIKSNGRNHLHFSEYDFRSALARKSIPPISKVIFGSAVDTRTAAPAATIVIDQLEKRGIVRKLEVPAQLMQWYEINEQYANDVLGEDASANTNKDTFRQKLLRGLLRRRKSQ